MISVVVATKNEILHIQECLESLENQNFDNYEVIFVDGRSNDGTREFLEEKIKENPKFSLSDNPNGDAASGRNIGIKKAEGEIVAFIDSDAFADKDWLKNIELRFSQIKDKTIAGVGGPNLLPQNQPFISYAIGKVMASPFASGGIFNPSVQHITLKEKKIVKHIPTCNLAIKREIFNKEGLFDERLKTTAEDFEFSLRLVKKRYKSFYDPEIKVWHYRKRSIKNFSKQIIRWGMGRALIIKKHGFNFNYLLPLLAVSFVFFTLLLALFLPYFFTILSLILICYIFLVFLESIRISLENKSFFLYALSLFPLIHISYTFGLIKGLFKKL